MSDQADEVSSGSKSPYYASDLDEGHDIPQNLKTSSTLREGSYNSSHGSSATSRYTIPRTLHELQMEQDALNEERTQAALRKAWLEGVRDQKLTAFESRKSQEFRAFNAIHQAEVKAAAEQTALEYQRNVLGVIVVLLVACALYYVWYCATLGPEFAYLRNRRIEKLGLKLADF